MDSTELMERSEEVEARLRESQLAEKCVRVASTLGNDRESKQRDCYTNLDYLFEGDGLLIDCNIGANMQGDGRLFVKIGSEVVFDVGRSSYSASEYNQKGLPETNMQSVSHTVVNYRPGEWETEVERLAASIH